MLGPFATSCLTPIHQVSPLYCRTPPAHRCPKRQRVTEGTAMAPWNGPKNDFYYKVTVVLRAGAEDGAPAAESAQVRRCRADYKHFL